MNKTTVTAVAGYFTVATFLLMHSLPFTGLTVASAPGGFMLGMGVGLVLVVLAVLSWLENQGLDGLTFFLLALMVVAPVSLVALGAVLWYFVVFLGLWMAARSAGGMRFLFLLLLDIALALQFVAGAFGVAVFSRIGAWVAVIASFAALYYATAVVLRDGCGKKCLPGA
jgi:succinate-acetate transporter protein